MNIWIYDYVYKWILYVNFIQILYAYKFAYLCVFAILEADEKKQRAQAFVQTSLRTLCIWRTRA